MNGTSFEIPGGKSLAVVGTSGSGKYSTSINWFIVGETTKVIFSCLFSDWIGISLTCDCFSYLWDFEPSENWNKIF